MLNFIKKNYYFILVFFILYILFNIVRDSLINQYFNIDPYESVKDAEANWKAIKVRNMFTLINKVVFPLMGIISAVLLFYDKKGDVIKKGLQIVTTVLILIILFISIVSGNF
jgi:ABC-type sugar transport system permease subunit